MSTTKKCLILENDRLRAEFDPQTGALISLVNPQTGWVIQRRAELGRAFEMQVPLPDRRKNTVSGTAQEAPCVEVSPNRLTFTWDTLRSELGGVHDIGFTSVVTLTDAGLTLVGTINNNSDLTVETICYPSLGDLTPPAPGRPLYRFTMGYGSGFHMPVYPQPMASSASRGSDHPHAFPYHAPESPFMLITDHEQGLYVGLHDTEAKETVSYFFEYPMGFADSYLPTLSEDAEARIVVNCVHTPFVNAGETYVLPPIVLQPYVGDWHAGADIYKAWRTTWYTRRPAPQWVDEVHSWQQYQINGADDDLRMSYRELVGLAGECAQHGVTAIQLVGWNHGGQDRGNPSHDTDPRLGTVEDLQWAIAEAKKLGVRIIPFSKFCWGDRATDWYRTTGRRLAAKNPLGETYGYPAYAYQTYTQLTSIHTRQFDPMCTGCDAYLDVATEEFQKILALGAEGMLYDETAGHFMARYCFDPTHGHRVPLHLFEGDLRLAKHLTTVGDTVHPDFLYAGEESFDQIFQHYQLVYFRFGQGSIPLRRYLDPFQPMMAAVFGFDDRTHCNKCLQYRFIISYEPYNFKGHLDDFPRTIAYGKTIDALRTRYQDYLWDAEFRDTHGAQVTTNGTALDPLDFSVYHRADGKRAVVVCNVDGAAAKIVTIALDGGARGSLATVTPEAPDMQPTEGIVTIPPRSLAVVLEG